MKKIWVVGAKNGLAAKCLEWKKPFPNFVNADILILNLESLEIEIKKRQDEGYLFVNELRVDARQYIFDMLMTSEKQVIVIMSSYPEHLYWLPIFPEIKKIAPANIGFHSNDELLSKFLRNVKDCSYYIKNLNTYFFEECTNPKSNDAENYPFTDLARQYYNLGIIKAKEIQNVAKQPIGGTYFADIQYGQVIMNTVPKVEHFLSSPITFLPYPTNGDVETAIDSIISVIGEINEKESMPPIWEKDIVIPGLSELERELLSLREEQKRVSEVISTFETKIDDKIKLRRLLWAEGTKNLEQVVRDAFIILGFNEIRKIRADNLEDWVIDFQFKSTYKHAVFEVKASEKRTSLADLTQCNKWVEDYMLDGKAVKGVFLPNQYRLEDTQSSNKKRIEFAPNELSYAKTREICILPTSILFELVRQKLESGDIPTRESIEQKIIDTNGLFML